MPKSSVRWAVISSLAIGCTASRVEPAFSPDLAKAFEEILPSERVTVIITQDGVEPKQRLAQFGFPSSTSFRHVPTVIAELSLEEALAIAGPGVYLTPDRPLSASGKKEKGVEINFDTDLVARTVGADVLANKGRTGKGVTVALIDSGIRRNHNDFTKKSIINWADFVDGSDEQAKKDPYGHGTMVAGVLAGERTGILGVAVDVDLVSARVLDENGAGSISSAIAAFDWIIDNAEYDGTRVINVSVGAVPYESYTRDPLAQAAGAAVDAGLVVVAAAGNYGESDDHEVFGGIVSPANHPSVITVGAVDTGGTVRRSNDRLAEFSSRGPTLFDGLGKPDIVAPGVMLPLPAKSGSTLWKMQPEARIISYNGVKLEDAEYMLASGSSFAAPVVSGAVALLLERHPELTPLEIKGILELTSIPIADASFGLGSGAGEVNIIGATRLADSIAKGNSVTSFTDKISGETFQWGLTLYWDGFDDGDQDLSSWNANGVLGVGRLDDTGILWTGENGIRYVGVKISGASLASVNSPLWGSSGMWGTGILWTGENGFSSGRVWTNSNTWSNSLVWPSNMAAAGMTSPLFGSPDFIGLATPVSNSEDPMPPIPDFNSQ